MSLHQCMQVCVLLVGVISSFGLEPPIRGLWPACDGSKLSAGDIVKKPGDNGKGYEVQTCLGRGEYGEAWTLNGSHHVLKFETPPDKKSSLECLFGRIAAQKDSAHFVNCFDHGSAEVWTWKGSELVLKYEWKGGFTVSQRANGQQVAALISGHRDKDFANAFPDLNSALGHLDQLFHMLDALQKPGTIAPGIGVRQWHMDAHNAANILASADGITLIDYGGVAHCCDDPQECAVDSGFEDVKIEPCSSLPVAFSPKQFNFQAGSFMIEFMLKVVMRTGKQSAVWSDWFKSIHKTSLERLVMDLRSSTGPSREMFRHQWHLQNAAVILAMAIRVRKKDVQWPPLFMEPLNIANNISAAQLLIDKYGTIPVHPNLTSLSATSSANATISAANVIDDSSLERFDISSVSSDKVDSQILLEKLDQLSSKIDLATAGLAAVANQEFGFLERNARTRDASDVHDNELAPPMIESKLAQPETDTAKSQAESAMIPQSCPIGRYIIFPDKMPWLFAGSGAFTSPTDRVKVIGRSTSKDRVGWLRVENPSTHGSKARHQWAEFNPSKVEFCIGEPFADTAQSTT